MVRFPFTVSRLQALDPPEKGRVYHYDGKTPGLCVCVTHTGTRTFYYYKKVDGRPQRIRLGVFPGLTIVQARDAATKLAGEIATGEDPAAERRARRESPTFEALHTHWMETHAKLHKKSWREDDRQYRVHLKHWGARRLNTFTKAEIARLHAKIGKNIGITTANRLLALIRSMFNKADELGFNSANPTRGIKMFKEQSRDRFLQHDELPKFFVALTEEEPLFRDYFLIALLTGARRANLLSMAWVDIDLNVGIWRIPDTKSGVPVVLPLVEPALRILQTRHDASDGSPWVFPSCGATGHVTDPKKAWARVCERAGLENLRMHDLRRTLGSFQAMGGSSLPVIGKSLGHTQLATTMIYARLQTDTVRQSVDMATTNILDAGSVEIDADGVKLLEERGVDDGKK